jgi:opacity protein-like surface antigen
MPVSGGTYTSVGTVPTFEGGAFKDYFGAFPGAQLEVAANISSSFGVFGSFNADFMTPKDARVNALGATYTQSNATQLSGYIGPRYYFTLMPGPSPLVMYTDAALGMYSLKYGEEKITYATNPSSSDKFTYASASQLGFNIGAGINIIASPTSFITVGIRYHNIMKKDNVTFGETYTHTEGTITTQTRENTTYNIAERGYLQISAGIGFKFGL